MRYTPNLHLTWGVRLKIYPTLNLQHGRVVSTAGTEEPCPQTPADLAERLIEEGATRLALVDVDAAMGRGNNRELIAQILHRCRARERKVCIQVAGGIRSSDQAQFFIDLGATWLVAGTILHKSPMVSEQLMARFQSFLTAAIDARGGKVHRSGWVDSASLSALDLALRAKAYGFRRLLFVDIPENAAAEPDFQTAQELATATGLPLIMGGSLTSPTHLETVHAYPGLKGALVDALLFKENPRLLAFLQATCA
ncbi:1-(5-phosphoribosyl)-5-[(5-phosphoribosylamino) methylideneamino] imidazole-4-carboxamide isomerase [Geothrix limicola]|uniref:1-(5-phosphoribosyl)-5-[(5-phosphoribosylamino) methylideneamino] imidazole-4-carboxamide isomerase n=1 Tax=Geothrix limicola TaxID=2927978 RepID=A0ABQ5QEW4_9BACT|nr:HisA/HisF-related TIM barrel protein [Geothrix limicola]GLH73187.1 1-(5-phosphoribosyl)-5-[(5-phosphoribosylamino) methylideneamino] imidazole-4-carboxamide isomerase [Geothrix limicola]